MTNNFWSLEYQTRRYAIPPHGISIGRGAENQVVIADNLASRRHALVWFAQGNAFIRDEGSTNGTFVNGTRVTVPTPLRARDQIQIGQTILIVNAGNGATASAIQPTRANTNHFLILGGMILVACLLIAGIGLVLSPAIATMRATATASPTLTLTPTQTWTPTVTASAIPSPTSPPTRSSTPTHTPTARPTWTATPIPASATPLPTATRINTNLCELGAGEAGIRIKNGYDRPAKVTIGGGAWGTHDYVIEAYTIGLIRFPSGRYTTTIFIQGVGYFKFAEDRVFFEMGDCRYMELIP
jgi:predicted component of type VI protein secretion system